LTAALLPPRLRDAFALRYGKAEEADVRRFIQRARRIYPRLPARLRYVGPYQEAEQRLAGRTQPDFVARMCNRFWMVSPRSVARRDGRVDFKQRYPNTARKRCGIATQRSQSS
jgi:hypothetical protein